MAVQNGGCVAPRRILFLDAYDSFTSNIVSLLRQVLGNVHVYVRHMDLSPRASDSDRSTWTRKQLIENLKFFDAVVCGPGPGSPLDPADVGAFETIWNQAAGETGSESGIVPVLGVCLGFQSLVCHTGGRIRKLRRGLHGMVRDIYSAATADQATEAQTQQRTADIFTGVRPFKATLYHSLCADIGQDTISDSEWPASRYSPTPEVPDLMPLAWTEGRAAEGEDERILMAVRHIGKPFWGLQYHPESVCTDPAAHDVLRNWWAEVQRWNKKTGRCPSYHYSEQSSGAGFSFEDTAKLSHADHFDRLSERYGRPWSNRGTDAFDELETNSHYSYQKIDLPSSVSTAGIAEILGLGREEAIILDSSSHIKADPLAKFSIIALDVASAPRILHCAGDSFVTLQIPTGSGDDGNGRWQQYRIGWESAEGAEFSPWQAISKFWSDRHLGTHGLYAEHPHSAFKGGFMGFITYESGLDTLSPGTVSKKRGHERPDICLAWVAKSIVLDHLNGSAYVQALCKDLSSGQQWCDELIERLQASSRWTSQKLTGSMDETARVSSNGQQNGHTPTTERQSKPSEAGSSYRYYLPGGEKYRSKVRQCQDAIREGNSYELCLTAQTIITRPTSNSATPWGMFRTLRSRQPAPFGSFIRLGGATLLSSSPERFLKYSPDGLCSMRPMKGTVRKSDQVSTLAQAEEILHVPKEEAENLMIVDLVRHDLHGICGSGRVAVPELLKVEEYATVFQMVTNVQGQLPLEDTGSAVGSNDVSGRGFRDRAASPSGLDVLSSVLPPGSMTGAPKKRSCEILNELEGGIERSLYSGVVGYMDVTGRGDWSVTIRSTFKWDDEVTPSTTADETEGCERWHIGAGGAVTILSTPEGEYDEMRTKLQGPLNIFKEMEQR